jgi:hypothetical protein
VLAGSEIGVLLLWPIVGGIVGYLIGRPKGRRVEGTLLGALFSFVGWIIVALIPPALGFSDTGPIGPQRTCPSCAEAVKAAAIVCRFCGRDLPAVETVQPPPGWEVGQAEYDQLRSLHPHHLDALQDACERAGYPDLTERALRRAITDLIARGATPAEAVARHSARR